MESMEARMEALDKKMDCVLKNQSTILAILSKLTHEDVPAGDMFPIKTVEELERAESKIAKEVPKYDNIVKKIIKGDLSRNLDGILGPDLIMLFNYDGILGKMPFKNYTALNNALLNAVKEDGISSRVYIQLIRAAFKNNKGRIAKRKYDKKVKVQKHKDNEDKDRDPDIENNKDIANLNVVYI
ncbi:hypothetical protein ACLKA6_017353 [Drosophila palustris]